MQAIANFTNKWPIGKSHVCDYVTTVTNDCNDGSEPSSFEVI